MTQKCKKYLKSMITLKFIFIEIKLYTKIPFLFCSSTTSICVWKVFVHFTMFWHCWSIVHSFQCFDVWVSFDGVSGCLRNSHWEFPDCSIILTRIFSKLSHLVFYVANHEFWGNLSYWLWLVVFDYSSSRVAEESVMIWSKLI